jgi:tetratricopeptide (TPR) repeat protein
VADDVPDRPGRPDPDAPTTPAAGLAPTVPSDDDGLAPTAPSDDVTVANDLGEAATPRPTRADPTLSLAIGHRLGERYTIVAFLGVGGMGAVFRARDLQLDRDVALKVVRGAHATAAGLRDEVRVAQQVTHRNVCRTYDLEVVDGHHLVKMELIEGETLAARLARGPRLPLAEVVAIARQLAAGLAAAHAVGVIHRDLKPANVMLAADGRAVLMDFGLARTATVEGEIAGTPGYMAPEQLAGGAVDGRTDLFALGCVLYELLTGARAFPTTLAAARAAVAPTDLRDRRPDAPRRLGSAVAALLAADPAQRPAGLRALDEPRRRRAIAIGAVAACLALAAGVLVTRAVLATPDRCAAAAVRHRAAYTADQRAGLAAALPRATLATLDAHAAAWRALHGARCDADQPPSTIDACLEARRVELAGTARALAEHPGGAAALLEVLDEPARCATGASGLATARLPEDPALSRRVSALRVRIAVVAARDQRGDHAGIDEAMAPLVDEAARTWPVVHGEALLVRASLLEDTDRVRARATAAQATLVADAAHDDRTVARACLLVEPGPDDDVVALTRADAAITRLGRPPALIARLRVAQAVFAMHHGDTASAGGRIAEALRLAPTSGEALSALAFLAFRRDDLVGELATLRLAAALDPGRAASAHGDIALSLALQGDRATAQREADADVAAADRTSPTRSLRRATAHLTRARVLNLGDRFGDALAELKLAEGLLIAIVGERAPATADALLLHATILLNQGRAREALPLASRSCDISAFYQRTEPPRCELIVAEIHAALAEDAPALAAYARAVVGLERLGIHDIPVADAYLSEADLLAKAGRADEARAAADQSLALWANLAVNPVRRADALARLGRFYWPTDPVRGNLLFGAAVATLAFFPEEAAKYKKIDAWWRAHRK